MENNKKLDWLLITDQELENLPTNIRVSNAMFSNFKAFVQEKFDFPISMKSPYKICDFRPAFGHIFSSEIKGYDFWGHCDLDVIFGDVLRSIPESAWENDRIFGRGSLSFYRNVDEVNYIFSKNYLNTLDHRVVFTSEKSFFFDEWHGINKKILASGLKFWNDDSCLFDIDKNYFHLTTTDHENISPFMDPDGRIYMKNKPRNILSEGSYIHLQKRNILIDSEAMPGSPFKIRYNTIVPLEKNRFRFLYVLGRFCVFYGNRMRALSKRILRSLKGETYKAVKQC
jgi:hypothetical protein